MTETKPKRLSDLEKNQLLRAVKHTGSYNPEDALPWVEEELTFETYDRLESFLKWCHTTNTHFGWGNVDTVWNQYREATA